MNLKFTDVAVLAMLVGAVTVAKLAFPAMAQNNDKCITIESKEPSSEDTNLICLVGDKETEGLTKDIKKLCKDLFDNKETQCSSSQTGNEEFGNGGEDID